MKTQRLKYIICKLTETHEYAVIFSEKLTHSLAVDRKHITINSAGFCVIYFENDDIVVEIINEDSKSLNMSPRIGIDETIIRDTLIGSIKDYLIH